jgi:heterodisulfide reductase subunit B
MFYAKQRLEKAEADVKSPHAAFVKFLLGTMFAQQAIFQKAQEKFKAIEKADEFKDINSTNGIALQNNLALVLFGLGKPDEAEKILFELTKKSKNVDASTWINLAMAYWMQDKTADAVQAFETANKLTPNAWPWIAETKEYLNSGAKGLAEKINKLKTEVKDGQNIGLYLGCVIPNRYPYVEAATRTLLDALNVGVSDLEGASCCPAPGVFRSFDIETWLTLGARNIQISEQQNRDLVTMCNGCYGTLNDVNYELHHDKAKKDTVNEHLKKIGKEFKGSVNVKHLVELLYYDIGLAKIKEKITTPFKGLKLAIHLGCHIVKPHKNKPWDDSFEAPHFLTDLVEATGAQAIKYKDELMCCGAGGGVRSNEKEISLDFTREKLENMRAAGIDAIVLCCPFCELQFDLGQTEVNSIFKEKNTAPFNYPVIYISQLIGMAMGIDPYRLGVLRSPKPKGVPPFQPMESMFVRLKKQIDV